MTAALTPLQYPLLTNQLPSRRPTPGPAFALHRLNGATVRCRSVGGAKWRFYESANGDTYSLCLRGWICPEAGYRADPADSPVAMPSPVATAPSEARGTQYFVANIDEARQVVAGCRDG